MSGVSRLLHDFVLDPQILGPDGVAVRGIVSPRLLSSSRDGPRRTERLLGTPVGRGEGEGGFEALGRGAVWWREGRGRGSCSGVTSADPAPGCACEAAAEGRAAGLGLIAGLMAAMGSLRRPRRRSGDTRLNPISLVFALTTACGAVAESPDAGEELDGEVVGDAGARDSGPPDLGATSCQVFCSAYSECLAARSVQMLELFADEVHCMTESPGLAGCATRCESIDPSDDCLECSSMCDLRCREVCPGSGLSDTQWPIWDHQTCWFGAPRPTESCTDPRSVTSYSGTAYPPDPADTFFLDYTGTATVVSAADQIVRTPSGREYRLGIGVRSEVPIPVLEPGSTVQVEIRSSCLAFGCSSAFVLRDDAGALLAAGWSGRGPLPVAELDLRYEGRSCLGLEREHYFELELELLADATRIRMGQYAAVGDFYVFNGRSTRYYAVTVTDTPFGESSGVVVRRP